MAQASVIDGWLWKSEVVDALAGCDISKLSSLFAASYLSSRNKE
jgi:hypothetical protein